MGGVREMACFYFNDSKTQDAEIGRWEGRILPVYQLWQDAISTHHSSIRFFALSPSCSPIFLSLLIHSHVWVKNHGPQLTRVWVGPIPTSSYHTGLLWPVTSSTQLPSHLDFQFSSALALHLFSSRETILQLMTFVYCLKSNTERLWVKKKQ